MTARGWAIALGVPAAAIGTLAAWGLVDAAVRGHWPFLRAGAFRDRTALGLSARDYAQLAADLDAPPRVIPEVEALVRKHRRPDGH